MIQQRAKGNPAVRWGVIFGLVSATLSILASVFIAVEFGAIIKSNDTARIADIAFTLLAVGCAGILVALVLFFLAGFFAARDAGTVLRGTLAGMIAGALGGLLAGIASIVLTAVGISSSNSGVVDGIVGAIVGTLVYGLIGAGVGALGGLLGRSQYNSRHPQAAGGVYQESMYQGMPPQQSGV